MEHVELRGDGIVLRPWREDDAPAVYAACQDPEILWWLPLVPRPYTIEHARAYVAKPAGPYSFAIEEGGRVVGSISVRVDEQNATGSVG